MDNVLLGLKVQSTNDAWAVGHHRSFKNRYESHALIQHWDGTGWNKSLDLSAFDGDSALYGIDGTHKDDVWSVGSYDKKSLIVHWNGSKWITAPVTGAAPAESKLYAVTAITMDDVWAVGTNSYTGTPHQQQSFIVHWDGSRWQQVASPSPAKHQNVLRAITATGPDDVWAVGDQHHGDYTSPLILHWDGMTWTLVDAPDFSLPGVVNESTQLYSIAVVDANDIWAVGMTKIYPDIKSVIMHWDGNSWDTVPLPNITAGPNHFLSGITVISRDDIWAVGTAAEDLTGPGKPSRTLVLHWDGSSWQVVPSPYSTERQSFSDVVAVSGTELWALGDENGRLFSAQLVQRPCNSP